MDRQDENELKRRLAIEALRREHRGVVQRIERGMAGVEDAAHVRLVWNHLLILQEMMEELTDQLRELK